MKKFVFILLIVHCSLLIVEAQQPTLEWAKRFTNGNGLSVKLDSAGNVYVLMKIYTDTTLNDYGLLKYDPAGNLLWNRYYDNPGSQGDEPKAFAVSKAGDVYITGRTTFNFSSHMLNVKYNTDGFLQWVKEYQTWGSGDIILDNDENIIIVGGADAGSNTGAALTAKLNSNGDSIWVKYFIVTSFSNFNEDVAVDDSDNVYTCGTYKDSDYLILKYSKNGDFRWYQTYNNPQNTADIADFITVDINRNVYVIGTNLVPVFQFNNTLLKINSNGAIEWAAIFAGILGLQGRCQYPAGVVAAPDGSAIYYTTFCSNGTGGGDMI